MKKLLFLAVLPLLTVATRAISADASVSFNEIMYHPATNEPTMEWVELRNQLAVDVDISGWSITGGIDYTFASNTVVRGGGFLVVALSPATLIAATGSTNVVGPFLGRLSNNGDTVRLRNNSGRVVDEVNYGTDGDWPVAPDGSGASLAKRDREGASGPSSNWTVSEQIGGTPGTENFFVSGAVLPDTSLVTLSAVWKYEASGNDLGTVWRGVAYNDAAWSTRSNFSLRTISGLFNTGVGANGVALPNNTPDPHYLLTANANGGTGTNALAILNHPSWLANDSLSSWIGVLNPGNTTINGGNYYFQTSFSLAGYIPGSAQLSLSVAVDNDVTDVAINGFASGLATSGFAVFNPPLILSSGFVAGNNTLEFRTVNQGAGPGGFRATVAGTALGANTNPPLPVVTTCYFRKSFLFSGDAAHTRLRLNAVVADGAVVYLNGVEVYRQNMPGSPVVYSTAALSDITTPNYGGLTDIPAGSLVSGTNVLAVEVHQGPGSADAPLFGADLISTPIPVAPTPPPTLAFNELSTATNAQFWLELFNYGPSNVPLAGCVIVRDGNVNGEYVFPSGPILNAGAYLAVTNTTLGFHPVAGDKLYLLPPARNKVLDAVEVKTGPRAREPAGSGPWLHPSAPSAGGPNAFAFHDEIVINEILYSHRDVPGTNGLPPTKSPEEWVELYNRSSNAVNLTGWELGGGLSYHFFNKTLAPGGYLVVARDAAYLRSLYPSIDIVGDYSGGLSGSKDTVTLNDPAGNPANKVRYYDSGRWPDFAAGGGSSLELRDPWADNSKGEAWAASDERGKSSWITVAYTNVASIPSANGQPTVWNEFILGLLGQGECLIDDLSVIESPATAPFQMVANGNFENGLTGWRVLGTHVRSRVEVDPDNAGNHVLHVITSGPQEHMHNHIETSTVGYHSINATLPYAISFRARWVGGNNLLNTRLYFNRCARTTALPVPALNGTPGAPNSRYATNIGPTFSQFQHSPVVPQPGSNVAVSVVAQDPQGVNSCDLWWSTNGVAFSSAPMTAQGGGLYTGTIPGYPAGAVVQFYARAVDGLGAAATYPAATTGALYAVADGQANLNLGHNIRIVLTPPNVDLLYANTNVMSNDRLPATVIYDERRAYYGVGVRLKGSERGRANTDRMSFHLEFPPEDPFRGVHPFMLVDRSGAGDSTANKQQEILIKHILLRAGDIPSTQPDMCRVIAPKTAHTGPALFSPRHEDEFVESAFADGGSGIQWELELIYYPNAGQTNAFGYKFVAQPPPNNDSVTGTDITDLGSDKEFYRYNFIIKNHRDNDDYSRFISFAKSLSLSGSAFEQQTKLTMDVNEWMRAWALVTLCGVGDTYTFGNNHNLFMYSRPSDGRVVAFPVDMDFSFNRATSAALVGDQNISKVITNVTPNLRCFYAHILDIINISYNPGYMTYWANHYKTFAPGQDYSATLAYMQTRGDFAKNTITAAGGSAAFTVTGTNFIVTSNNLITLSGTAPVQVKTIWINGKEYPVTWTSLSTWTLRIAVGAVSNVLNVVGYDVHENPLTNFSRVITVNYTGAITPPEGVVVLNEIQYNPATNDAGYVEIYNSSPTFSYDVSGWRVNGIDYTFPEGTVLTSRQFLVLARSAAIYTATFTNAPLPFDEFHGALQNDGETLTLLRPMGTNGEEVVVDQVRYEPALPWPLSASGTGPSLQLIDPAQDNSRVANWSDGLGWRYVTYTTNVGGSGASDFSMFLTNSASDIYIDDLVLVQGTVPEVGVNLITNGGFEFPLSPSWIVAGLATNSAIVSNVAHSGSNSVHLVFAAGAPAATYFHQGVTNIVPGGASPNTLYTLSFWYQTGTNSTMMQARLNSFFRFAIDSRPARFTPGAANSTTGPLPPFPPLWLNEAQPENLGGFADIQGDFEPWVEIYNAGTNPVSLAGCYLSDNYSNLAQWAFPPGAMLQPGQFKVVFADGEPGESTASEWHANFRLAPGAGSVALSWTPAAAPQVLDYLNYTNILPGRGYGDFPDGQPFYRQDFYRVTPGATNNNLAAPLVVSINEWMAANSGVLVNTNNNNKYDDWFELYNPGGTPANLAGYYLTDTLSNRFQFAIPAGYVIPPHGFLLVWADNETGLNSTNDPDLHVNFKLEQDGEHIALIASDGALIDLVTFEPQFNNVTQGRFPDGGPIYFLTTPTPRAPNVMWADRYPTLEPIPDATAYIGIPFMFTAMAADPDAPPQTLTFSLDPGAPAGAAIDPVTGAFSWTPPEQPTPATNAVTVRVTDNSVLALSAFQTFRITVKVSLLLSGITHAPNGDISFTVGTTVGKTYRLEYKDDLNAMDWTQLGPDHLAMSATWTILDNIGANTQRFYQVVQVN